MLPQDPALLLSVVNMKLRDEYTDIEDLCTSLDVDRETLEGILREIGFSYDKTQRQFR